MVRHEASKALARQARPLPAPTELSEEYWRAAAHGQLVIQRCDACGRWNHPPVIACPSCGTSAFQFAPVSGFGTIVEYVIVRQTKLGGFEDRVPYGAAAVELDEQEGLVVVGNVLGCLPEEVKIGARVRVEFEPIDKRIGLPQFSLLDEHVDC
jgi:uncharacterized OB-fold protein